MTHEPQRDEFNTRRTVLAGVGLAGVAGTLAACGLNKSAGAASGSSSSAAAPSSAGTAAAGGSSSSAQGTAALASTSEIPMGGGKIFASQKVVVTQPTSGEFKAFSAICTHAGCTVDQVANGTIDCPCHGSQFSISTGAVTAGPAPSPLPAKSIKVTGDQIMLG